MHKKTKIDFLLYVLFIIAIIFCMKGCLVVHEYEEEQRVLAIQEKLNK